MAQDSAQSPRLGQKVAVENAGIPLVTGANMPPAPWNGLLVYRTDASVFQVYSSNEGAWLDPGFGSGANKTFFGGTEPAADNLGDLWIKTPENSLHYWDGTNWVLSVDPIAEAASIAAGNALAAANQSIYSIALANATGHASNVLANPVTHFSRSTSTPSGREGDLWLEPTSGKLRVLTDLTWEIVVTPAPKLRALTVSSLTFYVSSTLPRGATTGDLLLNQGSKKRFNVENWGTATGNDAILVDEFSSLRQAYAQSIIDKVTDSLGELTTWFQSDDPSSTQTVAEGDVWFKMDVNLVFRREGSKWTQVTDPSLVESLNRAADARAIADGKIVTFRSANNDPPESPSEGDLWSVMDRGNLIRRWDGGVWVDLPSDTGAIAPGAIGNDEIGLGAVGEDEIAPGAIGGDKLNQEVNDRIDSPAVSDGLPPTAAPIVKATDGIVGSAFLQISGPENPDLILGYEIHISQTTGFTPDPSTLYAEKAPELAVIEELSTHTPYFARVAAVDADGAGPFADEVSFQSIKIDPDALAQQVLDDIDNAGADAATAVAAANKKNSNTFAGASTPPSNTVERTEGDIHSQTSGGAIIKQWVLTSGSWAVRTMDGMTLTNLNAGSISTGYLSAAFVRTGSIHADRIMGHTITSDQIHTTSIISDSIATNGIIARNIQTNAVRANHILAGEINATHIHSDSITSAMIQTNALNAKTIYNNRIYSALLSTANVSGGSNLTRRIELGDTGQNDMADELRMFNNGTVISLRHITGFGGVAFFSLSQSAYGGGSTSCSIYNSGVTTAYEAWLLIGRGGPTSGGPKIKFTGSDVQIRNYNDTGYERIQASSFTQSSYKKFKKDVAPTTPDVVEVLRSTGLRKWKWNEEFTGLPKLVDTPLEKVLPPEEHRTKGKTSLWKKEATAQKNAQIAAAQERAQTEQYGLIADELPEFLQDGDGYSVTAVTGFLWETLKNVNARVEALESKPKGIKR